MTKYRTVNRNACCNLKGPPYLNAIYVKPSDHLAHTTWHPVHWPLQRDAHIYTLYLKYTQTRTTFGTDLAARRYSAGGEPYPS